MIPELMLREWEAQQAPWSNLTMVEQDLVISRTLIELYKQPAVYNALVFRGGTALNKLYINPASRYSEDLDFVQINAEPIGVVLDAIRDALDPWLDKPRRKMTERSVKLIYRYETIGDVRAKLKIEINTTEHIHFLDLIDTRLDVASSWFTGSSVIKTYQLDELMGTKLRALYQRKKGRDLFDLWYVLTHDLINRDAVISVFTSHCKHSGQSICAEIFEKNLLDKQQDQSFRNDMQYLIHPRIPYDFDAACEIVLDNLILKLPSKMAIV